MGATTNKFFWGPVRALLHRIPERSALLALSVITGILCGLAAVCLKLSIHWIQEKLADVTGPHPWAMLVLPGVGMLLSLLIVRYLVKDNIGHGVTKVLQAVSKNESKIKSHNCWSSLVTSALTIGFGGSVGAEAPIVYTGAAIGSNLGRYCGMSYRGMTLLLGCGAAGAVAGIFNAPLAGVLFTLEILLFNLSMSGILPLLLSSVSATLISYLCLGRESVFAATVAPFDMRNLPFYLVLGAFCGLISLYFIRATLSMEDRLGRLKNPYLKWVMSAVLLGVLIFLFPPLHGEGYNFLGPLLNGQEAQLGNTPLHFLMKQSWSVPLFFLLVLLLKVFSMTFTNAGGGVGGTFGPTLFMGAIAGFTLATSLNLVHADVPVSNFVLVGMAGLMAGVMQAPLTAIFLIAEISGGYTLLVPLIVTSAISYGVIRIFDDRKEYIAYTEQKEWSAGVFMPSKDELAFFFDPDANKKEQAYQRKLVLHHEMFHQYLHQALGEIRTDVWFNEGSAKFFELTVCKSGGKYSIPIDRDFLDWARKMLDTPYAAAGSLVRGIL